MSRPFRTMGVLIFLLSFSLSIIDVNAQAHHQSVSDSAGQTLQRRMVVQADGPDLWPSSPSFVIEWSTRYFGQFITRYVALALGDSPSGIRLETSRYYWQLYNSNGGLNGMSISQLKSIYTNQCIALWTSDPQNGQLVGTRTCADTITQKWTAKTSAISTTKRMIQYGSKCLSVPSITDIVNNNKRSLSMTDCNENDPRQLFILS